LVNGLRDGAADGDSSQKVVDPVGSPICVQGRHLGDPKVLRDAMQSIDLNKLAALK
jgi:hypothetical protein